MSNTNRPRTIIGNVFACVGAMAGIPIGAIKGGMHAMQGGSFEDVMAEGFFGSYLKAGEFGDKHGGKILSRLITGVILGVGFDLPGYFGDSD